MSRIDPDRNLAHHGLGVFAQCMSDLIGPLAREESVPSGRRVDSGDDDKGFAVGEVCADVSSEGVPHGILGVLDDDQTRIRVSGLPSAGEVHRRFVGQTDSNCDGL